MAWNNLRVLLAVARNGSLTKAAQELGINQSTASRNLFALEAELGAILFVRSKSGFAPTDAGEAAIRHAEAMERTHGLLVEEVAALGPGASGTVRVLGNQWMLSYLAEVGLADFYAQNPMVDLRMIGRTPHGRRGHGEATISLWFEMNPREGDFCVDLGPVSYAVFKGTGLATPPNDWLVFRDEDADRPEIQAAQRAMISAQESIRLTATDAGILASAAAGGAGKALLPVCLAARDPRLERVSGGPPEFSRMLRVHANPDTIQTKRLQATVEWLRKMYRTHLAPSAPVG